MYREYVNEYLRQVIIEAQELKIPVPANINKQVYINPRPKKRFGCCNAEGGKYNIEISEFVLNADSHKIKGVIAHEVLHTCNGCCNHGDKWKEYAGRMNSAYGYNIKRTSSFEEMSLDKMIGDQQEQHVKYILKCLRCGKEYPRQRYTCVMKKINAYRCQCGGKLTLIRK